MPVELSALKAAIHDELARVSDARVREHIERLLIEPRPHMRTWDYGAPGERYLCWMVFEDRGTGVAYCEQGFGPRCPWGLVFLEGDAFGMDSAWCSRFLDAVREGSLDDLPIWRVYKTTSGKREAITPVGGWDETWKQVMALREADPGARYDCDTDAFDAR
jgi:hypothetical protein